MLKVFEFIYTNPKESILTLILVSAVVYTALRILKGFFSLFIKGKKRNEQAKHRELQADIVIEKLGGINAFTEQIASKVIDKMQPNIQELKQEIDKVEKQDKCPVELKAYIETVLKTNPNLLLQYEELKCKYKANSLPKVLQQRQEIKERTQETIKEQAISIPKKQEDKQEDITYV